MRRFVSRGMHRQSGSILGLLELCFVCVCFRSESAAEAGNLKMEKRLSEEPKMAVLGYAVAELPWLEKRIFFTITVNLCTALGGKTIF